MKYAPSLFVGGGILAATGLAMVTVDAGWWVMSGPLLLALTVVGADALRTKTKPTPAAWLIAAALLLASAIVALDDPAHVKLLLPTIAGGAWVVLILEPRRERRDCRRASNALKASSRRA